jgi:hypothetical protein
VSVRASEVLPVYPEVPKSDVPNTIKYLFIPVNHRTMQVPSIFTFLVQIAAQDPSSFTNSRKICILHAILQVLKFDAI